MKTALVTGGTKGIGLAIANRLAKDGIEVIACSRERPNGFPYRWEYCDALKPETIWVPEKGVDILVNNVGGGGRWGSSFLATPYETFREVDRKNAEAAVRFTQLCIPYMIDRHWGRVVTIASVYGAESGGRPWFDMTKSAEIALMKALSRDKYLVRHGLTFNAVCPGHISVAGKPDEDDATLQTLPMGRMGRPEEVAGIIAFLCSEQSSFINGAAIAVDGGESHSFSI